MSPLDFEPEATLGEVYDDIDNVEDDPVLNFCIDDEMQETMRVPERSPLLIKGDGRL
jgi:hypothetical protein